MAEWWGAYWWRTDEMQRTSRGPFISSIRGDTGLGKRTLAKRGGRSSCPFRLNGRASLLGADERTDARQTHSNKQRWWAFTGMSPSSIHLRNRRAVVGTAPAAPWLDWSSNSPRREGGREREVYRSRFNPKKSGSATDKAEKNVCRAVTNLQR